jgi:hypothetical protein
MIFEFILPIIYFVAKIIAIYVLLKYFHMNESFV